MGEKSEGKTSGPMGELPIYADFLKASLVRMILESVLVMRKVTRPLFFSFLKELGLGERDSFRVSLTGTHARPELDASRALYVPIDFAYWPPRAHAIGTHT